MVSVDLRVTLGASIRHSFPHRNLNSFVAQLGDISTLDLHTSTFFVDASCKFLYGSRHLADHMVGIAVSFIAR